MEIISQDIENGRELCLKGRFDANWADHVGNAIESAIRAGHHQIDLDLAQVDYLSSAGIRVLLKYFKQLQAAHGALRVVRPTESVFAVLRLSGIAGLLVADIKTASPAKSQNGTRAWERNGIKFESHEQSGALEMEGRLHGNPEKFVAGQLAAPDSRRVHFDPEVVGLGLGAFGSDATDCRARFGEFLAVGGVVVAQPTDGSSVPDFQVMEGELVPELNVLYGLTASGTFSKLLRFEAAASKGGAATLAALVEAALEESKADAAAFVFVAESASLVGATLRQSPALANGEPPLNFPAVRDWVSFTSELNDERQVALIVGFAHRAPQSDACAFLRPLGTGSNSQGHFHGASFGYRPLPKGNIGLRETVTNLLASESARAVMHLLSDERQFEGVGQTELMRGACWVGPLRNLSRPPLT